MRGGGAFNVLGVFQMFRRPFSRIFSERPSPIKGLLLCRRAQSLQPCHGARVLVIGIRGILSGKWSLHQFFGFKSQKSFLFLATHSIPRTVTHLSTRANYVRYIHPGILRTRLARSYTRAIPLICVVEARA
jgi:hypothetical protein